jgi:hypothetical protein
MLAVIGLLWPRPNPVAAYRITREDVPMTEVAGGHALYRATVRGEASTPSLQTTSTVAPPAPRTDRDPASWWATHRRGIGDRPRPGTRVRLRDGRPGSVTAYEGCWKSCTFPVLIDRTGQSLMVTTSDVTELVSGGKETRASEAAG